MRKVDLKRAAPAGSPEEALRVQKLTGHLWARLMELEEDGLRVLSPAGPRQSPGQVSADAPGKDPALLARRLLEDWGVSCRLDSQGTLHFAIGPGASFEELDYVQDAVYKLLLQS